MESNGILHLTLKKKWFDMILSGEKKEEYREMKPYWQRRLFDDELSDWKDYHTVRFTNGYGNDKPSFDIELYRIEVGNGKPEWGAKIFTDYYILELGEVLETRNINSSSSQLA